MVFPGANVLAMALRVIASQPFQYVQYTSRSIQSNGMYLAQYAAPVNVTSGSVQPVPRALYEVYGLQFDKNYKMVYVPASYVDVSRDVAGDQIIYAGNYYQVMQKTDWFEADNWIAMLVIQVLPPG